MTSASSATKAVLFDLDGTLADTAPDLAFALNETLIYYRLAPLPEEVIRPQVSHGGVALIRLGFELNPGDAGFDEKRQRLLDIYSANICNRTSLFPGMGELLIALRNRGIRWGVVTNKPSWLTDPLMASMHLPNRPGCVVSGDTCAHSKPHPEPILHACTLLEVKPEQTLYVGDAERDMLAAQAAGSGAVCALFGYIQPDDQPELWPADHFIQHPMELMKLISGHA